MYRKRVGFLKCGLLIGACIFGSSLAYGDLILSFEPVSASPGSSGDTFDVLLTDSGSPGVSVAGFNFTIQASSPAVTFTGVFTSTATAPYIFAGNSSSRPPDRWPGYTPTVTAFDIAASGSTTLNSGDVVGLGQVSFNVSPTVTAGPITLSFVTAGGTGWTTTSPTPRARQYSNRPPSLTGQLPSPVPHEPSSMLMMLAGVGALAAWKRRRRA